jgi:hypothetical protein
MAQNNELVLTITARDQATETLKRVKGQVKDVSDDPALTKFGKDVDAVGAAFDRLGTAISPLAGSLRQISSIMSGSLAGAATGLAGAVTAYGLALNRVADEQLRFQRALNSINADTVRGELARITDDMNKMADAGNRIGNQAGTWTGALQSFLSRLQMLPQAANEVILGAQTPESQRDQARTILGGLAGVEQGVRQTTLLSSIEDTRQRAILFEMQRRLNEGDIQGALALKPRFSASDQREEELAVRAIGPRARRQDQGRRARRRARRAEEDARPRGAGSPRPDGD